MANLQLVTACLNKLCRFPAFWRASTNKSRGEPYVWQLNINELDRKYSLYGMQGCSCAHMSTGYICACMYTCSHSSPSDKLTSIILFCYVVCFPLHTLIVEIVLNMCYQMVYNNLIWTLCIHNRLEKLLETKVMHAWTWVFVLTFASQVFSLS